MNAIMNKVLSNNSQYVFQYQQFSFFQWQKGFILLRQRHICSATLNKLE